MGIMKSTNRLSLSKQFIDFLLSPSSQHKISTDNYDYPTVKNAPMSPFLSSWGAYPIIPFEHMTDYYQYLPDAKALIKSYQLVSGKIRGNFNAHIIIFSLYKNSIII